MRQVYATIRSGRPPCLTVGGERGQNTFFQMWLIFCFLMYTTRAHSSCADCCHPDRVCDTAYKNEPGVCCGGKACCPRDSLCVQCEHGVSRCAFLPFTECTRHQEIEQGAPLLLLVIVGMCTIGACWLCSHSYHSPLITPVTDVVASSPHTDVITTGLIGGVLLTDVLHDNSPEPEPPSYVEATFDADV
jgi:hypothetical protein